jgi:hypothetical protein
MIPRKMKFPLAKDEFWLVDFSFKSSNQEPLHQNTQTDRNEPFRKRLQEFHHGMIFLSIFLEPGLGSFKTLDSNDFFKHDKIYLGK